jgi:hypothetical protein
MLNSDYMGNKTSKITSKTSLLLLVGLASILASGMGQAATDFWNSSPTSSDWSTGSNWSLGFAPTSADVARFGYSTQSAPTLGAGLFTVQQMYWYFSGTKTSYNITGAGSANTTLKIDPNTTATTSFIRNVAVTGASNQTFSNLTLLLEDSNLTGQTKIQPGDGGSITIASNATLQIGSTTAQAVILEANDSTTGSAALTINGVLIGVAGSSIKADASGVLNLNLAAGSSLANLNLSTGVGGVINFVVGGNFGGSVNPSAGRVNLATSGITIGSTTSFAFGTTGIAGNSTIGATYTTGTSTIEGQVVLTGGGGAARNNIFDVAGGGTLIMSGLLTGGNTASTSVSKTGTGTLSLTKLDGNSISGSAFNVSEGTLLVNNTSGSATGTTVPVNVASGATLGGAGRITGATTISGILAPGNSIGTLTVVNDVTWNGSLLGGGATTDWKFELGAANTADLLNITGASGNFTKGTGSVFRFDFQGSTATGTFKLVDWVGTTGFTIADFSYTNLGPGLKGSFRFNGTQLEFVSENKSIPSITTPPTASAITVGQALSISALTGGDANTVGTFTFTDPSIIPSTTGNYTAEVTFTPDDLANYTTATTTVSVMVNPETPIGTTFAGWSSSATPTPELVAKYAIGGATSLTGESVKPTLVLDATTLSITAIVRTDDPTHLSVVGQAVTSLADYATPGSVVEEVVGDATGIDQTGVPTGCEKQKFSVNRAGAARKFLRLNSTLTP